MSQQSTPHAGTTPPAAPRRRRRSGFSLIEILIVLGVILILFGIGIYGYRSMEGANTKKQTMGVLATADALLKEMNSTGSYARVEGPAKTSSSPPDQPDPYYTLGLSLNNPGDVTMGKTGRNSIANYNAAVNTPSQPRLMRIMKANPKIATMISSMPSDSLLPPDPGAAPRPDPVLADAWQNPLLLVPSGGLKGVKFDNGSTLTITSSGQATSPANRAFWASAGPDGNFATGDDNLYSFQK